MCLAQLRFFWRYSTSIRSTNMEVKTGFYLDVCMCVCVCLCENVSVDILRKRWPIGWKLRCMLQLASNREPLLTSTIGPLLPPFWGGGWFVEFFEPLHLENHNRYRKTEKTPLTYNLKIFKFAFVHFFDISNGFRDILKKRYLEKGVAKTSWLGSKHV